MHRHALLLIGVVLATSAAAFGLASLPAGVPTDAVPSGSMDPWAGRGDAWVVARVSGPVAFDGPSARVPPDGFAWDEASGTLRLAAPDDAPFVVRGAFLLDDGSLRLVPVNAALRLDGSGSVLAFLLPDVLRLDARPAECPVTVGDAGRAHDAPVGTALAPGEGVVLRFGPAEGCAGAELRVAFVALARKA